MIFKKGDRVQVIDTAESYEDGWQDVWVETMDDTIGEKGTIEGFSDIDSVGVSVDLDNGEYWQYPYWTLRLVRPSFLQRFWNGLKAFYRFATSV